MYFTRGSGNKLIQCEKGREDKQSQGWRAGSHPPPFQVCTWSQACWVGMEDLDWWGRVCVTWFDLHFLKLVCDTLKILCYSGAWQIKGSHRFFDTSHWRVGSIFISLESGQALWLFWPIEYGESDTVPVFPAYVFKNWQLPLPMSWNTHPRTCPPGYKEAAQSSSERHPRETQTRVSTMPIVWVTSLDKVLRLLDDAQWAWGAVSGGSENYKYSGQVRNQWLYTVD